MIDLPGRSRWRAVYALGFLLYFALQLAVFGASDIPWREVVLAAAANTLPLALLGIGVVAIYARDPPPKGTARNAAIASAFALAVPLGSSLLFLAFEGDRYRFRLAIGLWMAIVASLIFGILAAGSRAAIAAASLARERARVAEAEALRTRAELVALRARLDPHFLFNTLHSLLALVRESPAQAEQAIEHLGDLMRATLEAGEGADERTLGQEWQIARTYLEIEKLRLGERLRFDEALDAPSAATLLPALTLQPIVENAVRHAIAPRVGGGRLVMAGRIEDGHVVVTVADDGPGADPASIAEARGLGLRLVRERLDRAYDGAARMEFGPTPGGGLTVTLRIPREAA
ncbi:MAG: histidine kinase [Acidobacteriota bacterium]